MNLLQINEPEIVSKTALSRKLTLENVTKAYPVYRVRLDQLYYNDQNDRIATWITQYKRDGANAAFSSLAREDYNDVIERFIIGSNPAAIEKTKNNIALVNQREPGVVLSDGRIIDGNRRYTCLRMLRREDPSVNYFETVILDANAEHDRKQIKMLELAIQHGEEQRVDYNQIDMAIGAYHDIIETNLLSIEEYASSTNESIVEIKRRLATAQLIIEFLSFMNVPGQYHIAREMQVYTLFYELVPLMKRCETEERKNELRTSVFNNVMLGTFSDQRKYIRSVKEMMDSGLYASYMKKQTRIAEELAEKRAQADIHDQKGLESFVKKNEELIEELQVSMDRSLLQSKKAQSKSRPTQIISKSITLLNDVDTGIIEKMSDAEKDKLRTQLNKLSNTISLIGEEVMTGDETEESDHQIPVRNEVTAPSLPMLGLCDGTEPYVFCSNHDEIIRTLSFTLDFSAMKYCETQSEEATYQAFFADATGKQISEKCVFTVQCGKITKQSFTLNAGASGSKECRLILRSERDKENEAQSMIPFRVDISFSVDFDF